MRMMAANMWQIFVSLRLEGFTEAQALQILGCIYATAAGDSRA